MKDIVFYSWQSDLPNATNRTFIQGALEKAAKGIRDDESVSVEPVIDRDTLGIPGTPDIARTIFDKIEKAQVFVCDVSLINHRQRKYRHVPNPNVLIELGFALKALGPDRVLMVMNSAYGKPERLPFDLSKKRVMQYCLASSSSTKEQERKKLVACLRKGLETILTHIEHIRQQPQDPSLVNETINTIEKGERNEKSVSRRFMREMNESLAAVAPSFPFAEEDDVLRRALAATVDIVADFGRVVQTLALYDSADSAKEVHKELALILASYVAPKGFSGHCDTIQMDFYRFIGHEIFVTFIAALIREDRWELIAEFLNSGIYVENDELRETGLVQFQYASYPPDSFLHDRTVHAGLLQERHSSDPIQSVLPLAEFMDADFLLRLRAKLHEKEPSYRTWNAWSTLHMSSRIPRYLLEAEKVDFAKRLVDALGCPNIHTLKQRLIECSLQLPQYSNMTGFKPYDKGVVDAIGTRP